MGWRALFASGLCRGDLAVNTACQCSRQLSKIRNFDGLTGTYSFFANGDPMAPRLQIVQYRAGAWAPVTNIAVAA